MSSSFAPQASTVKQPAASGESKPAENANNEPAKNLFGGLTKQTLADKPAEQKSVIGGILGAKSEVAAQPAGQP